MKKQNIKVIHLIFQRRLVSNGTKNFRRSKSTNADENGSLTDRDGRDWNLGLLWYHRVSESDGDNFKINGNRCGRKYGIPYQVAEGATVGSLPADSEQFMLIEHMSGQVEKIETAMQDMMSNTVNIERLQKDVEKILSDIEKLKDKQRTFANGEH